MPPIFRLEDWNEDAGQSTVQESAVMHEAAAGLLYCCPGAGGSAVFPFQNRENGEEAGNISPVPVPVSGAGVYGAEEENICAVYALFYALDQSNNSILSNALSIISDYKKRFLLPDDESISEDNRNLYLSYNQELLLQSAIDYDDILFYAYQILTECENVRHLFTSQYKFICVDEAQDLNYAQYMVIKALCGNAFKNIMLVGDENQSIYGFNGSDSSLMSEAFVKDFNPVVYVLNENFRCAKAIVNFANTLEAQRGKGNTY